MATQAAQQLYPFSSDAGDAIPLDIVRPLGAIKWDLPIETALDIAIPADFSLVCIFSNVDCLLDFSGVAVYPVANASLIENAMFIPADTLLTVALPNAGAATLVSMDAEIAGVVRMTALQKWAAIGLQRSLVKR